MAYDEANALEKVVKEIYSVAKNLGKSFEIIIVNDGSSDKTGVIADQLTKKIEKIRVIHHKVNKGLGEVYRTGFANAKGEYITFFPADGQFPATIIKQFFLLMNNADMVLGYLPKRECPYLAQWLSFAEKAFYRLLFGPIPKFQGIFMLKREALKGLELKAMGRAWTVVIELIIRASRNKYKIISVPTEIRPRMSGKSKVINFTNIWMNFWQMVMLRFNL